jgi:DNA-directed RNA polymerase sigma subunit (sigma70/sigma32)
MGHKERVYWMERKGKIYYKPAINKRILSEQERAVIYFRYFKRNTLEETAEVYCFTRERIRQIEAKGMLKLFMFAHRKDRINEEVLKKAWDKYF